MPSVLGCLVLPTRGVIPVFHRRFRVSYLIQIPKAIRLKSTDAGRFQAPPPPKAPVRYTCVQDPGEASLGSLLLCVGRTHPIPECLSGTNLAFIGRRCRRMGWTGRAPAPNGSESRRGCAEAAFERRPSRPRRSRELGTRSWQYPNRWWQFACGSLPDVIRWQRLP
jgi:hypothetical protein